MPLLTEWKYFQITADANNIVANDQVLGDLGKGVYEVSAIADVADATISIFNGRSAIIDSAPIPIRAAAVTYPEMRRSEDNIWRVVNKSAGANLRINVTDGTSGDVVVKVRRVTPVKRRRVLLTKQFLVTADTTNLFSGDQVFGDLGKGVYGLTVIAAAAADSTYTVSDGRSNVLNAVSPAVRAAAVTYPNYRALDDSEHLIKYIGEGPTLPVDINDGTNAEIIVVARWYG